MAFAGNFRLNRVRVVGKLSQEMFHATYLRSQPSGNFGGMKTIPYLHL